MEARKVINFIEEIASLEFSRLTGIKRLDHRKKAELISKLESKVSWYKANFDGFPFMRCGDVMLDLKELGFYLVGGMYMGKFDPEYYGAVRRIKDMPGTPLAVPHDFSYDPRTRLYIDLTARQFDRSFPEILLLEPNDPRLALSSSTISQETTHYAPPVCIKRTPGSIL